MCVRARCDCDCYTESCLLLTRQPGADEKTHATSEITTVDLARRLPFQTARAQKSINALSLVANELAQISA